MQRILRSLALVLAATISATAQTSTFPSPGAQSCASTTSSLAPQSHVGVVMTPHRYTSAPCISSTLSTASGASQFCLDNSQVAASEGSPVSVHIRTCAGSGCVGQSANIVLDFTTGSERPKGLSMLLCDVDNRHDSILVNAYAGGMKVAYTHSLRGASTSWVRSFGSSPDMSFDGTGSNNSSATTNWAEGAFEISFDATKPIDSVVLRHIIWEPAGHNSSCPSWTVTNFRWQAASVPLATTLVDFRATAMGNAGQLDWTVLGQTATAYTFAIERSADGKNWVELSNTETVRSTIVSGESFSATDHMPLTGVNYYRLRVRAADGRAEYTSVHTLRFAETAGPVRAYPNPVARRLHVRTADSVRSLRLVNAAGMVVRSAKVDEAVSELDVAALPTGLYYLHITGADGATSVEKVIKTN